jgi:hypothetical protein
VEKKVRVGGGSGAKIREECGELGRVSEGWGVKVVNGETIVQDMGVKVTGGDQSRAGGTGGGGLKGVGEV